LPGSADIVSGLLALGGVEPTVIVLVELFDDLDVLCVWTAAPKSAGSEWRKVLAVGRRKRESLPLRDADAAP
jgi:hypothetical protein